MVFFQFIIVTLFVEDLVVWATLGRSLRRTRIAPSVRAGFHVFFAAQIALMALVIVGRLRQVHFEDSLPTALWVVVITWHLLIAPVALIACLLGVFGQAVAAGVRLVSGRPALPKDPAPSQTSVTRREFLGSAMAMTPPALTIALSAFAARQLSEFRVRHIAIHLRDLPQELDGMTIAHVSDLHLGQFTHGPVAERAIAAVNALQCDLVLFSGDLINDSLGWLPTAIGLLKKIDKPLYLCQGNHDMIDNPREFDRQVKAAGLKLLINETATVPVRAVPVQILGLRWGGPPNYGQHRHDEQTLAASMRELVALRDPAAFPILLAHHPHAWDYATDLPLTLAGHTHGGQLMLNERLGFGPVIFRYWSGLYTDRTRSLVVSNGVGNWFPIRTAAPAELVHLTLHRETPFIRA